MRRTDRTSLLAVAVSCLVLLMGCVSVHVTGAATVADFAAEQQYNAVYSQHMAAIHLDSQPLIATSANPGVCNKGGTKQGCFDEDALLIRDLQAMQTALSTATIPPRYVDADKLLKAAIDTDIQGLSLRNQAIASVDDAVFQQSQTALASGTAALTAAYMAFPADNRPLPAP